MAAGAQATIAVDPLAAASVLAALVLANAGAMVAAYVSIRVQLAVLQSVVNRLETDVNNLAGLMRGDGSIRGTKP